MVRVTGNFVCREKKNNFFSPLACSRSRRGTLFFCASISHKYLTRGDGSRACSLSDGYGHGGNKQRSVWRVGSGPARVGCLDMTGIGCDLRPREGRGKKIQVETENFLVPFLTRRRCGSLWLCPPLFHLPTSKVGKRGVGTQRRCSDAGDKIRIEKEGSAAEMGGGLATEVSIWRGLATRMRGGFVGCRFAVTVSSCPRQ